MPKRSAIDKQIRREARQKIKRQKHRRERKAAEKLLQDQLVKSLELPLLRKTYPDEPTIKVQIKDMHPELQIRFTKKCEELGFTKSGKIRRFMVDVVEGKLKEAEGQPFDPDRLFGPMPKGVPTSMLISSVPECLYKDFQQWCANHGVSVSWKIKQLMFAYIQDIIA